MVNEPPIESLLIDMRKRLSAASGWTDKAIAEMPNHVIEHMTSTAREVLAALEPSPDLSPAACRVAFERWAAEGYNLAKVKTPDLKYHEGETQSVWLAWQVAWAIAWSDGYNKGLEVDGNPSPDSSIAAFEHLASGLYRWDAETKTLIGEGFAKPDTVPCDTCDKPMPDRGGAKSWCSDACYGKSGEALVGKLESEAYSAGDERQTRILELDPAIAIVRQHYTNSPVCKDSEGQCIQTDHAQREIRYLSPEEQRGMHSALGRSVTIVAGPNPSISTGLESEDLARAIKDNNDRCLRQSVQAKPRTTRKPSAPEPVSVKEALKAIDEMTLPLHALPDDEFYAEIAKACAKAWGLKYVE